MSKSDITFDGGIFNRGRVPQATKDINAYLISQNLSAPKGQEWWDIGTSTFRSLQDQGKTSWPAPTYRAPHGSYVEVPSPQAGRDIKCRVIPPSGGSDSIGTFLYIHGGGHVLAHCDWFDVNMEVIANATNLTVVSPEYRLAPEDPFPAGFEDVYDVAEHFVDNSPAIYGGPLRFAGGESAGATLTMLTLLHLLDVRPHFSFKGIALMCGLFDWSLLPSNSSWPTQLILSTENVKRFGEAAFGTRTMEERRNPAISPIYHPVFQYPGSQITSLEEVKLDAKKVMVKLPPALFLCGTLDPLVDDTVLMSFKWQVAGGEAVVKFVPGAAHGLGLFPKDRYEPAAIAENILLEFLKERS